ncbi:MAG: ABC transporter ATP-binding protein [Nitrososphaerota archaeon]|nr:ABC transporter ATP-binding protein [Nitrososphaerota archaeon]
MSFLEIKDLHVRYHTKSLFGRSESFDALKGINLQVPSGSRFGIVGESGSGKSTIARVLVGLVQPNEGEVFFEGMKIRGRNMKSSVLPTKIQVVFQDPYGSLDPGQKIFDALYEPLRVNKIASSKLEANKRISELFQKMGLAIDLLTRFPHELSGGQRQRVCIARAVLLRPALLVLDEPTSSLDLSTQAQIAELIKHVASDYNFTYIFISHNLELVGYMCDTICVMRNGQVVEIGDKNRILNSPGSTYTKELIEALSPLTQD